MMEAVRTSETSVDNHFTRQYIPEDNSEHHTRRHENLKSHINKSTDLPQILVWLVSCSRYQDVHLNYRFWKWHASYPCTYRFSLCLYTPCLCRKYYMLLWFCLQYTTWVHTQGVTEYINVLNNSSNVLHLDNVCINVPLFYVGLFFISNFHHI
jgi:hypothetical protein